MTLTPIDGRTQLVGLIGWPLEHSMSPAMHNAAFQTMGLNWRYLPLPVPPGQVDAAVGGLAALGFCGANVTVPHKQSALRALERLHGPLAVASDARVLGAVNTLVHHRDETAGQDGKTAFTGHNTDVVGFVRALQEAGVQPTGTSAVVVGAGGGARAVVYALMAEGARDILVLNRTVTRAETLVSNLRSASGGASNTGQPQGANARPPTLHALVLTDETLIESARSAHVLVNATPVGMWPRAEVSIWPAGVPVPSHLTVFDLVYNPLLTKLQRQARASSAHAINGLDMLVHQGALALEMWTDREAPVKAMRSACERSLRARGHP